MAYWQRFYSIHAWFASTYVSIRTILYIFGNNLTDTVSWNVFIGIILVQVSWRMRNCQSSTFRFYFISHDQLYMCFKNFLLAVSHASGKWYCWCLRTIPYWVKSDVSFDRPILKKTRSILYVYLTIRPPVWWPGQKTSGLVSARLSAITMQ